MGSLIPDQPAYLDTSVVLSLMTQEVSTAKAEAFIQTNLKPLLTSDFTAAELASAISRMVRMQEITKAEAAQVFLKFDQWRMKNTRIMSLEARDVARAETYLRRLDLTLRAPDAMHIAMTHRAGAELVTFDIRMSDSARVLAVVVATI